MIHRAAQKQNELLAIKQNKETLIETFTHVKDDESIVLTKDQVMEDILNFIKGHKSKEIKDEESI